MGTISRVWVVSFLVLLKIGTSVSGEDEDELPEINTQEIRSESEDGEIFKPTKEWQTVKKGQAIPPGLHVRMNLEKGTREAKLLDKEEATSRDTAVIATEGGEKTAPQLPREVQEAILNISDSGNTTTDDDVASAMRQFRTYKELKKDLKDLRLELKTDMELMEGLLSRFKVSLDDGERVAILSDLEYLVHQFDNAREFSRVGGLLEVVFPSLNASSAGVRAEAALVLGSAAQGNPRVQVAALEAGGVGALLRLVGLDPDPAVRSRALYALSCVLRRFPAAQARLVAGGGLATLAALFGSERQDHLRLQVKVATLLRDLVAEREDAERQAAEGRDPDHDAAERARQYRAAGLEERLVQTGWCERIPRLLQSGSRGRTERRDDLSAAVAGWEHDVVEKVASAVHALSGPCRRQFRDDPALRGALAELRGRYDQLAALERAEGRPGDQPYFAGLAALLADVRAGLQAPDARDEL
ncbi:nucleotide exchange factor SIL1 isoform X2 [Bacillus rossius redtenbacheri]|uniref:nucleotide exchange factor SIL1 isoform X2 n=1 Tax=Bacillus rossius redtenbacheri TaxID=93214 RepID=UPI002FDD410F